MVAKKILFSAMALVFGASASYAGILNLTNGAAAAGHLDVGVDDFGSYGEYGGAIQDDLFEPTGGARYEATFTAGAMLFLSGGAGGTSANLLSGISDWKADLGGGTAGTRPLTLSVITPNILDAANRCHSAFRVTDGPGNRRLDVTLSQFITTAQNGVTALCQLYSVTNTGTESVDIRFLAKHDADLLWSTIFDDDIVRSVNGQEFMCANEPAHPEQAVALGSIGFRSFRYYFAGKQGFSPPGGAPDYGFGTDTTEWGVFGTPATWENNAAYVGYNLDGNSGANMGDAFLGAEWFYVGVAPGASRSIFVVRAYGTTDPRPTVTASNLAVTPGQILGGNLASTTVSDDIKLVMRPGLVFSIATPPIQAVFDFVAPTTNPNEITIYWESSSTSATAIQERMAIYNRSTLAYVDFNTRTVGTADSAIGVAIYSPTGAGLSNYVDPATRVVKVKFSYKQVAVLFGYPWNARIDYCAMAATRY